MKKTKINEAASMLAKKLWAGMTEEELSAHLSKIASLPRTAKRRFCGLGEHVEGQPAATSTAAAERE